MRKRLAMLALVAIATGACGTTTLIESGAPFGGQPSPSPTGGTSMGSDVTVTPAEPGVKPTIAIPDGAPPTQLVVEDLTPGTGAQAAAGQKVQVNYMGVSWSTKQQFDASFDSGRPFDFTLGQGNVIPGWDQGVAGMKVGGRRLLVIPPELGYGAQGAGQAIGPNETLVFVVDLLAAG